MEGAVAMLMAPEVREAVAQSIRAVAEEVVAVENWVEEGPAGLAVVEEVEEGEIGGRAMRGTQLNEVR